MNRERVLTLVTGLVAAAWIVNAVAYVIQMQMLNAGRSLIVGGVFAGIADIVDRGPQLAAFLRGNR